jgi:broad specificity polyphosphatase/5'/3'-nucleotidase SurE
MFLVPVLTIHSTSSCQKEIGPCQQRTRLGVRFPGRALNKALSKKASTARFLRPQMNHLNNSTDKQPCILLTNDDGVESRMLLRLADVLKERYALDVVVIAPKTNQSACSHRLTLATPMELRHRSDLQPAVYSLDGSPADCVIAATEPNGVLARLGMQARLVVSGPNIGANLAQDVLHSGTFSGARQAGLYGLPALACSLADDPLDRDAQEACVHGTAYLVHLLMERLPRIPPNLGRIDPCRSLHLHGKTDKRLMSSGDAVTTASAETVTSSAQHRCNVCGLMLPQETDVGIRYHRAAHDEHDTILDMVWSAFTYGDLVLNVNFPGKWSWGKWRTTHLGAIFYRDVFCSQVDEQPDSIEMVTIGAQGRAEPLFGFVNSDLVATREGYASVTTLQTWPESHPLQLNAQVVEAMALADPDWGLPAWMTRGVSKHVLQHHR